MGLYDSFILPRLLNCACGSSLVTKHRVKVVPQAHGVVLEVGIGSGLNLPHYDRTKITELIGIDPGEAIVNIARKRAAASQFPVRFILLEGESIPLEPKSVDTVVVTYTLCTIPGVQAALEGMRRVLKPGGRLLFCEHGLAPDENVARTQRRLSGVWKKIAGGCHLNRDIPMELEHGGFRVNQLERYYVRGAPRFAGYHYVGSAIPR
jgi:ubiquinone/menaquinone biosynthesis C-methylase UbiE